MDGFYSSGSSHNSRNLMKPKGLSLSGSVSPINPQIDSTLIKYLCSGSPVASGGDAFSSPVGKYQYGSISSGSGGFSSWGGSPLSSVENMERSPLFGTPVNAEEDVLVMDGILVGSVPGGRSAARSGSDSGGSGSSGKSTYKKEICRVWEDSGNCRYGSKCQFAHGKEELRPTRSLNKNKPVVQMGKPSPPSPATGSLSSSGSKSRPTQQAMQYSPVAAAKSEAQPSKSLTRNWSPYDDGIGIGKPAAAAAASREEVDAMIDNALYGPSTKKRLPVFADICPR